MNRSRQARGYELQVAEARFKYYYTWASKIQNGLTRDLCALDHSEQVVIQTESLIVRYDRSQIHIHSNTHQR